MKKKSLLRGIALAFALACFTAPPVAAQTNLDDVRILAVDYTMPVATSAEQYFTASPQNPADNSADCLCDGDLAEDIHAVDGLWPMRYQLICEGQTALEDTFQYINIYAPDGLPDKFAMQFSVPKTINGGWSFTNYRPKELKLYISKDSLEWKEVCHITSGMPDSPADPTVYTSPMMEGGADYKYFKMQVIKSNGENGNPDRGTDTKGHYGCLLTELNLYSVRPYTFDEAPIDELMIWVSEFMNKEPQKKAYIYGTTPGNINNSEIANKIYAAIDKVNEQLASSGDADADALRAAVRDYLAAKAEATDEMRVPVKDGYYYIVNAYTDGYAMCASTDDSNCYTAKFDGSSKFAWEFKKLDDGNWSIKNCRTGQYINTFNGPVLATSAELTNEQILSPYYFSGQLSISNTALPGRVAARNVNADYFVVLQDADWGMGTGNSWTLVSVPDSVISGVEQEITDKKLGDLIATAARKTEEAYVYDLTKPVATSGSQYFTASPQNPADNSADCLCDGDWATDIHAVDGLWPMRYQTICEGQTALEDTFQYIWIHSEEGLPDQFLMKYCVPKTIWGGNLFTNYRPKEIKLYISKDSTNWEEIDHISSGLPADNDAETTVYTSPTYKGSAEYKYFKMEIIKSYGENGNPDRGTDTKGHYGCLLTEFNLYAPELTADAPINDPEIKPYITTLETQLASAQAALSSGKATQADIDALQAALDSANAAWKDTTALANEIAAMAIVAKNLKTGTEVGNCSEETKTAFDNTYSSVAAQKPLYKLTKAQLAENTQKLKDAWAALKKEIVKPSSTRWQFITSADFLSEAPVYGQYIVSNGNAYGSQIINGVLEDPSGNTQNAWLIENDEETGNVSLRNVGTGMWMRSDDATPNYVPYNVLPTASYLLNEEVEGYDPSVSWYFLSDSKVAVPDEKFSEPFEIVPLGNGEIAFKAPGKNLYLCVNATSGGTVTWQTPAEEDLTDTRFAFSLINVDESYDEMYSPQDSLVKGSMLGYMSSTEFLTNVADENSYEMGFYSVTGKETDADGNLTGIKISKITDENPVVAAGTPVILYSEGDFSAGEKTTGWKFASRVNTPVKLANDTVNGLIGLTVNATIQNATLGRFVGDHIEPFAESAEQAHLHCIINPALIQDVEGATNDYTIPVKGSLVVGVQAIKKAGIVDNKSTVNVYTSDGVLLKKGVYRGDATSGLKKGVYIIGHEKVLVK